ncbi:Chalcone-flavanone isomerase family protein [Rhynchospora pubera]|uniref:Chalcone--flavanone isomerase n=1 Tax=Rhynchospora pubera TaxID=906938 RepID=A0AAV8ERG2_9POAL|nr:Chalcone-flavanone isomerase family protein [Rhynchospora pubera]
MSSSLGFPFSHFPRFPNFSSSRTSSSSSSSSRSLATAAALAAASALGLSLVANSKFQTNISPLGWASLSLANAICSPVESRTGEVFPEDVDGGRRLLGVGVRRTNVLGLKSIDVYAFGVYADDSDVKKLNEKYGTASLSELKDKKEFIADALESDIRMTVRLQIVYGRLSIRSVRNAFARSVGTRLQKFSSSEPSDTDELLQKFVSLFRDDQKLPKGSVIELSREEGYVLRTRIDGEELGQIQSKLLCKSILDLYFGEDPLDKNAKQEIQLNLASRLKTT